MCDEESPLFDGFDCIHLSAVRVGGDSSRCVLWGTQMKTVLTKCCAQPSLLAKNVLCKSWQSGQVLRLIAKVQYKVEPYNSAERDKKVKKQKNMLKEKIINGLSCLPIGWANSFVAEFINRFQYVWNAYQIYTFHIISNHQLKLLEGNTT